MSEPRTEQAEPTAPRAVDAAGRTLDRWGLPENGPARARALAETGKPDPRVDPDAWAPARAPRKPAGDAASDKD